MTIILLHRSAVATWRTWKSELQVHTLCLDKTNLYLRNLQKIQSYHRISSKKWCILVWTTELFLPLRWQIFYLAYKDTALIVMTAGHGAHCKEKKSGIISFLKEIDQKLVPFLHLYHEKSNNNRQIRTENVRADWFCDLFFPVSAQFRSVKWWIQQVWSRPLLHQHGDFLESTCLNKGMANWIF